MQRFNEFTCDGGLAEQVLHEHRQSEYALRAEGQGARHFAQAVEHRLQKEK